MPPVLTVDPPLPPASAVVVAPPPSDAQLQREAETRDTFYQHEWARAEQLRGQHDYQNALYLVKQTLHFFPGNPDLKLLRKQLKAEAKEWKHRSFVSDSIEVRQVKERP